MTPGVAHTIVNPGFFADFAWGIVTARYIWPELRLRPRAEALRPLLMLHSFRFIGLAFLVPGVVSPDLPSVFAHSAAYGDIVAAFFFSNLKMNLCFKKPGKKPKGI